MSSRDEERRHVRYAYHADMEYMLKPSAADEILKGAVVNLSDSGMSLFIAKPLAIGQEITVRTNLPNSARTAVVRWIKQVGGCYKIGAACNNLE
jgi:PilZ domain